MYCVNTISIYNLLKKIALNENILENKMDNMLCDKKWKTVRQLQRDRYKKVKDQLVI